MKVSNVLHETHPNLWFPFNPEYYPHPFHELELLENKIDSFNEENFFNQAYEYHTLIKEELEKAIFNFQFEVNLCVVSYRQDYLNSIVEILLGICNRLIEKDLLKNNHRKIKCQELEFDENYFPFYVFLIDAVQDCLLKVQKKYEYDISNHNKEKITSIFAPPEPILSFELTKDIPDDLLKDSFQRRLIDKGLIHHHTEFSTFKDFLSQKPLADKIEWNNSLGSLRYFIRQLINKDENGRSAATCPKDTHWRITSEFFTYQGGKKVPNLKSHQHTPRKDLRKPIELFVDDMKSLT